MTDAAHNQHSETRRPSAIATLQAFRAFRPIAGSSSPVQMLERFESAGCGARAGRGPVARSTSERARSSTSMRVPPIEPGCPGSFLVMIAMVGLRKQFRSPFIAVWKSDLVGSDIDPLHGVFGERVANRGWGPWFLRNVSTAPPSPDLPREHFPGHRPEAHRETRPTA